MPSSRFAFLGTWFSGVADTGTDTTPRDAFIPEPGTQLAVLPPVTQPSPFPFTCVDEQLCEIMARRRRYSIVIDYHYPAAMAFAEQSGHFELFATNQVDHEPGLIEPGQ